MGFWSEDVQQTILDTELVIAGTGGTGNAVGIKAAQIGIQRFKVADPEAFDRVNSNRVVGARTNTIGRNKAEVLREDILAINPDAEVTVYNEGINPDNVDEFLASADVALNGLELTQPELGVMFARAARKHEKGVPIIDVEYIGHAGQGTVFDPHSKHTFERVMGIKGGEDAPLDEVKEQSISPDRYLAYLPAYGDMDTLKSVLNGSPLPSNAIGAGVASDIAIAEILRLTRQKTGERGIKPTYATHFRWYDAYTGKSGETHFPRVSYARHAAKLVMNNLLGRNELASYTGQERQLRGDID